MNRHIHCKSFTILVAFMAIGGLPGCMVGPKYQPPEMATEQEFRFQIGAAEANSFADLPWWEVYDDKALQEMIKQGLKENYDLQVSVTRIEQARAVLGIAESSLYPQVGYEAFGSRQKEFVPTRDANKTYNDVGGLLSATWELDLWGRIRHSTESARAQLFAQEYVRRGVMLTLVTDIASGYFRLIELDRERVIAEEEIATYKQMHELFTARFESGKDTKLPVVRAQAAYDSSLAKIKQIDRAIAQQENALSVLLGAYPQKIARGAALDKQRTPATPLGQTTDILKRRPDIAKAEQDMISANEEVGVAVANFYPRIGLSTFLGTEAGHTSDLFSNNSGIWGAGASLAGPIFQGGRLREIYQGKQAFWDEAILQYKKAVLTAFRETSDALVAQQTLVKQRESLESQVHALRQAVDLAIERYKAGRASYFEVLEAERLLFPAQDALAQAQRDQLLASVNLYKALGGGWNLKDAEWVPSPDTAKPSPEPDAKP